MKNDWAKEVKKIKKDFLLINQNVSYQCKSIIDLINDPFLFRVFMNESNNLQNEQVLIYKKGFTYEIQGYFITEDSITPLDLISLIYFTDSKLPLFYLNILPNKIIKYLLPQLIQGMKRNKEIISVFKEEEIIHNVLFLLLSNICEKCYSLINKLNLLTCKECFIFLECFYKLRDTLFINSFNKQIFFINKLKEISEGLFSIKLSNKSVKKILIDRYIENISVNEIYFPFDYDYYVRGIVNESGIALQSAAKVPYMITLIVQSKNNSNKDSLSDQNKDNIIKNNSIKDIKNNSNKDYSIKDNNIKNNDYVKKSVKLQNEFDDLIFLDDKIKNRKIKNEKIQNENNLEFKKIIVKMGDDCRQDILTMQIIELFNEIFLKSELNIKLFPYKILTIRDVALIECVPDAITRDQMGKEGYLSIMDFFENKFGFRECKKYDLALQNFVSSYVGYSLLTYFVNIKDRHNANIMINKDGNLIHIDFGFIMELSPGNLNFELPVKLTTEIHNLLKSGIKDYFEIYKEKMVEGFLAIRKYSKEILNLVRPFSFLPCFKKDGINNLINRFKFNLSDEECKEFVLTLIEMAKEAKRTWIYDTFQYLTNDIRF
ncbi:Phosphatidylinositol 4-kinase [Tubulinosema ratisbonensis]|uniref:Phosphatidylinositol 4-kinase n=1 Tax=Tubulinosema ratisbonensis TaxID=291195 RepID=A0A437AHN5_9MICR|nr:Phosphatidylinositol 4-kinase [Tubulinosema ratisbonensis]